MPVAGFILAFLSIMYLSMKKVSIARVMFLGTVIMALASGMGPSQVTGTVWTAFKDRATLELAGAVLAIGIFSTVMKEFSFLGRTVNGLTVFLGNVKAAIMSVPALIGSMPVLGGAALSAPLVDKLGDSLDLSPDKKAAANLAFRHGTMFIFPFSPGIILASKLTGFPVSALLSRLWPMSVAIWGIGYLALLRKARPASLASPGGVSRGQTAAAGSPSVRTQSRLEGLGEFLLYGGPLIAALIFGLVLKWPLWLSLAAGTALACGLALVQRKPVPPVKTLLNGANLTQVAGMFWIMSFKAFVTASPVFPSLIAKATTKGVSPALMAILIPLAFGYGSASQTTTIGVLMPPLVPASIPGAARLYMACLVYASSFTSYFFSPLHMCQVLTCQYFKVDILRVYKLNWPILAGLGAVVATYYVLIGRLM